MRIVAGQYRGRPINPPAGTNTRPTIDRVREALFSSLYSLRGGFESAVVLDAFAGSGALGLEALSRGADKVTFCEKERNALSALQRNIDSLQANSSVQVLSGDVFQRPPTRNGAAFDLVLLDPPYKTPVQEVLSLLSGMRRDHTLAPGALITYEHGLDSVNEVSEEAKSMNFGVIAQKKYGKTWITILKEGQ